MAWIFGDGFDCYASVVDATAGYWDSGLGPGLGQSLVAGRFAGTQAMNINTGNASPFFVKSSAVNDAVHHIVVAFRQTAALSGTTLGLYFQLTDVAANQCCIVFRSDGTVLLTSATPAGTVLATYSGAVTAANTWFAFEFEVIISNTVGRFRARKNGNASDDFDSGASLNTRPGANAYANKLAIGMNATVSNQQIDDFLWRSDASSVPWVGDIRCYTRLPASDASAQFARVPVTNTQQAATGASSVTVFNGTARYVPFIPTYSGTVGTVTTPFQSATTCNMKCSIFASSGSAPTTALGSATPVALSAALLGTFTFGTPVAVVKGTQYWIGFDADATSGTYTCTAGTTGLSSATAYASFPVASPTTSAAQAPISSFVVTTTVNADMVNETLQDGTTSYVYDGTVGHEDFYNIAALAATPTSTVAVITRGFMSKSDTQNRFGTVQIKNGGTTVAATSVNLSSSFGWVWRVDTTDPATGAAWTAAGVNTAQIGPKVIS